MKTFHRLKKNVGLKILEVFSWKCSECGSSKSVCVHHIKKMKVGDPNYNDESNLTVLCRSCHMKHHRNEKDILTKGGRRGNIPPIVCHCGDLQHAKGLCRFHYRLAFKKKWYGNRAD